MPRIYEATNKEKRIFLMVDNDEKAHYRQYYESESMGAEDLALVTRVLEFPFDSTIDEAWEINGLIQGQEAKEEIIILEPFLSQNHKKITNLNEAKTTFDGPIKLSKDATILVPMKKYDELMENPDFRDIIRKMDVRVYIGSAQFAIEMLLFDKGFIFLDLGKDGFLYCDEERMDSFKYAQKLSEKIKTLNKKIKEEQSLKETENSSKVIRHTEKKNRAKGNGK